MLKEVILKTPVHRLNHFLEMISPSLISRMEKAAADGDYRLYFSIRYQMQRTGDELTDLKRLLKMMVERGDTPFPVEENSKNRARSEKLEDWVGDVKSWTNHKYGFRPTINQILDAYIHGMESADEQIRAQMQKLEDEFQIYRQAKNLDQRQNLFSKISRAKKTRRKRLWSIKF